MSLSDKFAAAGEDLKGKAKEAYGKATDDKSTEAEGKMDQLSASVKDFAADAKEKAGELGEQAKEKASELGANLKAAASKLKDGFTN